MVIDHCETGQRRLSKETETKWYLALQVIVLSQEASLEPPDWRMMGSPTWWEMRWSMSAERVTVGEETWPVRRTMSGRMLLSAQVRSNQLHWFTGAFGIWGFNIPADDFLFLQLTDQQSCHLMERCRSKALVKLCLSLLCFNQTKFMLINLTEIHFPCLKNSSHIFRKWYAEHPGFSGCNCMWKTRNFPNNLNFLVNLITRLGME